MIVPTHHHHDHAMGLPDYVKAGAKAVVPEMAKHYYKAINNIEFETFTQDKPYVVENDAIRAVFIHMKRTHHAKDQVYAIIMPACVKDNSSVLAFDADHLSRDDKLDDHNDQTELLEMLDNFKSDRVARNMQYTDFCTRTEW
ncbi:hypothetical protein BFJ71_g15821 [Fusarium oxysporum]|nr:hypothetical protein BFJ71_g15821 [Fusarium oxysporum]